MRRISFLQDIFSTVLDRRGSSSVVDDGRSMQELCLALLSSRGEVSGNRLAHNILARFENADEQQQLLFFEWLLETLDIDSSDATSAINSYGKENSPANWQALISATTPRRLELLRRINRTSESTGQLVSMREQLLSLLVKNPQLERIDADFEGLFKSWFNRGFLVLREIDWRTPANILEKIIHYEAVHAINDWQDLRRRLEPPDRKCFAFFHPAMQDEPLIFVEVALGTGLPDSIQTVLHAERQPIDAKDATTAIFYSISNCQPGLRGVTFGNFLIKHVATELAAAYPGLREFRTLTPVPSFGKWLDNISLEQAANVEPDVDDSAVTANDVVSDAPVDQPRDYAEKTGVDSDSDKLTEASDSVESEPVVSNAETESEETSEKVAPLVGDRPGADNILEVAANFLVNEKRDDQQPVDPVARFHLGNGASLDAVLANADLSDKGMSQSAGVMVSYLYDLDRIVIQHEAYASQHTVAYSRAVGRLLGNEGGVFRRPMARRSS